MARCRSCGAEIIWCKTENKKNIPVDASKRQGGNLILDDEGNDTVALEVPAGEGDYVSHFTTCGR